MAAIFTRFIGPTNYRGSRIKAWIPDRMSIIVGYDDELSTDENHQRAAEKCAEKYHAWRNEKVPSPWPSFTVDIIGQSPDLRGYTYHFK